MTTLLQDLRHGARTVVKHPGLSIVIVVTLALAIGANTVTFSFTNILVLRPLPVQDQDTLTWIFMVDPQRGGNRGTLSIPDLLDYRAGLRSFSNIAATRTGSAIMTGRGDASALAGSEVTANVFQTWGLHMHRGRSLAERADRPGAAAEVVLSHQFWMRQFGGDDSIVGDTLMLNGRPHAVVGVLRPEIEIGNLSLVDVWIPLRLDRNLPRDERTLRVSARLRPGVTFEQAHAEVAAISRRLQQEHPVTNTGWTARLADTREAMTGVRNAAAADRLPLLGGEATISVDVMGYAPPRDSDRPWAVSVVATDGFFRTACIPVIAGREFEAADTPERIPVAVVNETMARRYWGDPPKALHGRIRVERDPRGWLQIVGVVGDVKSGDLESAPNPHIYRLVRQVPARALEIIVRADDPDRTLGSMRSAVTALDRDVPIQRLRTMREAFDDELSSLRILTGMFAAFAVIALLLAASGLYAVISYSVSQRSQEIGIRIALGAIPRDIRALVVRQTAVLVGIGSAIGLIGGAGIARLSSSLLYEVSANDPTTYVSVAVGLSVIAALSALPPLRRATRVDPILALRGE